MSLQERIINSLWKRVREETPNKHKLYDTIRAMTDDNLDFFLQSYPQPRQYVIYATWRALDGQFLLETHAETFVCPEDGDFNNSLMDAAMWTLDDLVKNWDDDESTDPLNPDFIKKTRERMQDSSTLKTEITNEGPRTYINGDIYPLWEHEQNFTYEGVLFVTLN